MAFQNHIRKNAGLLSDINVTPLVDIMLVLLIVFMIAAPMLHRGIDVNLPRTDMGAPKVDESLWVISIRKDLQIFINEDMIESDQLEAGLKRVARLTGEKPVLLRADRDVPYGRVLELFDKIKKTGIDKVGLLTQPLGEQTP